MNQKAYNESLRLIDWFNPPSEKLPHGDDLRVGPKSDRTPRDNTAYNSLYIEKYVDLTGNFERKKLFKMFALRMATANGHRYTLQ